MDQKQIDQNKAKLQKMKALLAKYKKLFAEDGLIDTDEQRQIDELSLLIKQLEQHLGSTTSIETPKTPVEEEESPNEEDLEEEETPTSEDELEEEDTTENEESDKQTPKKDLSTLVNEINNFLARLEEHFGNKK